MQCKRGDVVLVPFPFTDLSHKKVRPALVISDSMPGENVVLTLITSSATKTPYGVVVSSSRDLTQAGLKVTSTIKTDAIGTFDKRILIGELGVLSPKLLGQVDLKLKKVLGL